MKIGIPLQSYPLQRVKGRNREVDLIPLKNLRKCWNLLYPQGTMVPSHVQGIYGILTEN